MSWFGERLTSISGKISDFTKEVLIDTTENVSNCEDHENPPMAYSSEDLVQVCKEKDLRIGQLTAEKHAMQRSIVELDDQHQEATNQLLRLKLQLEKDNRNLKTQLKENQLALDEKSPSYMDCHATNCIEYTNYCDKLITDVENIDTLLSHLNALTILFCFNNCCEESILTDITAKLEQAKHFIEAKNVGDLSNEKLLSKINSYINYFKVMCNHCEETLPFMKETASVLAELYSKNGSFNQNGPKGDHGKIYENIDINEMHSIEKDENETGSTIGTQTTISDNLQMTILNSKSETVSEYSQTDIKMESISGYLRSLDSYALEISSLEKEIQLLQEQSLSSKQNFSQQTELSYNSSFSQTDGEVWCNECSKNSNHSKSIIDLQLQKTKSTENISQHKNEIKEIQESQPGYNSVSLQTSDLCKCVGNEAILAEKNEIVEALQREIIIQKEIGSNFEKKLSIMMDLKNNLSKSNALINEKEYTLNCQKDEIFKLKQAVNSLQETVQQLNEDKIRNAKVISSQDIREKNDLIYPNHEQSSFQNFQEQLSVCDYEKLLMQLKSVNMEKSQLLCMLNEKSQECSSLKTEVHRLTSIVASEKQALFKLQRDNKDLKQVQTNNVDPDLAKEALQNLSRLVRDKDLEIEALKQKNNSLASVLQESSSLGDHVQTLVEERENLSKQIDKFKADREKIMKTYNAKDQKCRSQQTEITKLNSEVTASTEKLEILGQQYRAISLQYEEKQKSLINTQNEMILLKQKVFELEQQNASITEKYNELRNSMQSDSTIIISRGEFNEKLDEMESLKMSLKEKEDLIHEKDGFIHELSNNVKSLKLTLEQMQKEIIEQKKCNEDTIEKLKTSQTCVAKASEEKATIQQRLSDKVSELNLLKDENERLNMTVKGNEFAVKALEEKISSLTLVLQEKTAAFNSVDVDQILSESKEMYAKAQRFHRERDETLLSLNQQKQENQELKNEVQKLKTNEDHLKNELDRLRKHLLQIEENYTSEALRAEEREKEIRNQFVELERSTKLSSSDMLDASHQANIQVASLQEQVAMIAQQRDGALSQLSELEDKVQLYSASSNNLQLVLEKRQKEYEQKLRDAETKWTSESSKTRQYCGELQRLLDIKQAQLEDSSQALEAASRLSEILDSKEEVINILKTNLSKTEHSLRSLVKELDSIRNNADGKVDRVIMKSLVLGYFATPPTQKSEVVRLLARVLDFNQEEMQKAGIVVSRNTGSVEHRGIFSSLFGRLPSISIQNQQTSADSSEQSFTTLFVKFLENESQPIVRMPLPAEKMAQELTSKSHANKRSSDSKTGSPNRTPLLLNIDSAFPTFATLPAIDYSSPTILKEVLQ